MTTSVRIEVPFVISTPQSETLEESEVFVIGGIEYTVDPDVHGKIAGGTDGRYFFRQESGFGGREFVIVTHTDRRIVTRNIWMGEETDGPDTASFEGRAALPVKLARRWKGAQDADGNL